MKILLINGPNLNLLGTREPSVYGSTTLKDVENEVKALLQSKGWGLEAYQSNHEGELVDVLQQSPQMYEGVIFNPGAYTHTSIAIRDAIAAINVPVIEIHISNIHQRESFRHTSLLAPVCWGQIVGFGTMGYCLAAKAFLEKME